MEKKKTRGKKSKSIVRSHPKSLDDDLCKIGGGDWKKGAYKAVEAYEIMHSQPEIKVMHDVDILMSDIMHYFGENHYSHFDNFPAFMRVFLKRGIPDYSILNSKRVEKPIDVFLEDGKDE